MAYNIQMLKGNQAALPQSRDANKLYFTVDGGNIYLGSKRLTGKVEFTKPATGVEGTIYVDTNGSQGPNIGCRDYWRMFYYSDASVDGWQLSPGCKKNGALCPDGGSVEAERKYDWDEGCGNPAEPEDIDGIGRLIGNGWEMDW